jgi:hypothetical protein
VPQVAEIGGAVCSLPFHHPRNKGIADKEKCLAK